MYFQYEKYFKKQLQPHSRTEKKEKEKKILRVFENNSYDINL
jgi:hypothetical protein